MVAREILSVAVASLRANKLRSALTMLGIIIGIAAVIAVIAMGTGAQRAVDERIQRLGTTLLQINPYRVRMAGVQSENLARLTPDDAQAIRERAPHVTAVQAQQNRNRPVVFRDRNTNVRITGTTANYLQVRRYSIAAGEMFTDQHDERHRRVAVIGWSILRELGLTSPAQIVGQEIRIGGAQFTVLGVLAPKGQDSPFGDPNELILVPLNTGRFLLFGNNRLNAIFALAADEDAIPLAMAEIQQTLRREHRLRADWPDDFRIRNPADFLATMGETTQIFGALLAGVAAVSLLVGGVGIMNIMLVSVTERTREIGIRKALGATRRTILLQFLTEAVLLCTAGGLAGVGTGFGTALVLREGFGWNTQVAPLAVVWAFLFSVAVGIIFGVWPARRAAHLDPIVALRYE